MICRHCGSELRPGDRFCPVCGEPIAAPKAEAQPKAGTSEDQEAKKARVTGLVLAAQNGDENAFAELYQTFYQKVFALAKTTVKTDADAEDVLQQTFINVWNRIDRLKNPEAFSTWIQRITLNQCYSLLRSRHVEVSIDESEEDDESFGPIRLESDLMLPEVYAERSDLRARLGRIIDGLSSVQKQTILLYYYDGLPVENIAWVMDCSVNTVKSRLFLARKSIKTEIEEQERKSGQPFFGIVGLATVPFGKLFVAHVEASPLSASAASGLFRNVTARIANEAANGTAQAGAKAAANAGVKAAVNSGAKAAASAGAKTAAKVGASVVSKKIIAGVIAGVLAAGAVAGGTVAAVSAVREKRNASVEAIDSIPSASPFPGEVYDPAEEPSGRTEATPVPATPEPGAEQTAEAVTEQPAEPVKEASIREIAAGGAHVLVLKDDGTVYAYGDNYYGETRVSGWKDITAVSARYMNSVGLKANGAVVLAGEIATLDDLPRWTDVVAISAGEQHIAAVRADGTVVTFGSDIFGENEVSDWRDIVQVCAGLHYTVGLKSDGTVVVCGTTNYGEGDVSGWTDITSICVGRSFTVGLKKDGTVVTAGWNYDVSDWTDIAAISAGDYHLLGLRKDGTVAASGSNYNGECDVDDWRDIAAVSGGLDFTVGLKADGTLIACGSGSGIIASEKPPVPASPKPTAAPAPASTVEDSAYSGYYEYLIAHKDGIERYVWQFENWSDFYEGDWRDDDTCFYTRNSEPERKAPVTRAIAFYDVYGDKTPEMIYIGDVDSPLSSNSESRLVILTYENGTVKTLFSGVWDTLCEYESAFSYELYFNPNDKTLYAFVSDGITEYYAEDFFVIGPESDGVYRMRDILMWEHQGAMDEDEQDVDVYQMNGTEITEEEYKSTRGEILAKKRVRLIYGGGQEVFRVGDDTIAKSFDEALEWLREQQPELGAETGFPAGLPRRWRFVNLEDTIVLHDNGTLTGYFYESDAYGGDEYTWETTYSEYTCTFDAIEQIDETTYAFTVTGVTFHWDPDDAYYSSGKTLYHIVHLCPFKVGERYLIRTNQTPISDLPEHVIEDYEWANGSIPYDWDTFPCFVLYPEGGSDTFFVLFNK